MRLRRADADDAPALRRVLLGARRAAGDGFPPPVHPDEEMEPHLRADVLPRDEVWLAQQEERVVGVLTIERGRDSAGPPRIGSDLVGQLFVTPLAQRIGVGSALLSRAKERRPAGLDLWVFAQNAPARSFYRRRGFEVIGGTSDRYEECAPDLLMRWAGE